MSFVEPCVLLAFSAASAKVLSLLTKCFISSIRNFFFKSVSSNKCYYLTTKKLLWKIHTISHRLTKSTEFVESLSYFNSAIFCEGKTEMKQGDIKNTGRKNWFNQQLHYFFFFSHSLSHLRSDLIYP